MLEALMSGTAAIFAPTALLLMLAGIAVGFVVGLLPGLGGGVALALMIPFTFGMDPIPAFCFLMGMHSVTSTTGDITSVLFGVPGEGTAAATILDGHPMAKNGEAGRALGAALMSSLVGAIIGAAALALAIPIVQPLVLGFGSPQMFMLTMLGMTFLASLSGGSVVRGLAAGFFGFLLATVGSARLALAERFTFGSLYLIEGIPLVPVAIGMFAIPEIIDLAVRGSSISGDTKVGKIGGAWQGVKDTFIHWGLTLRASLIGTFIGIIPGLGGAVSQWVAYGHAVQSAKDPSRFGKGAVEGVIGPGAANNSKEGGALIPTVAFAVPGSLSMAILLGAFIMVGLEPGPKMLSEDLDVTFSLVGILVVSNIITVAVSLLFLNHLAKVTAIRGSIIVPLLILLITLGAFAEDNDMTSVVMMLAFGVLGYFMVLFHWPRPPLILGLVLGSLSESYLFITVRRYEYEWLLWPSVFVIGLITLAALAYPVIQQAMQSRRGARHEAEV